MFAAVLDPLTLDQLRALVAVVEEGSFSAAARKLRRVQSAISAAMANLEGQLGVALFDRSTRIAALTEEGKSVLAHARRVLVEVDSLRRLTTGMARGLEASVSLCVDALFPLSALVDLCRGFAERFPDVDLRVDTQVMSGVAARVLDGSASIGVVSPLGVTTALAAAAPPSAQLGSRSVARLRSAVGALERRPLSYVQMVPVTGPHNPLAAARGRISTARLADAVQIVLSERTDAGVADQAVLSPRTWRVADMQTKHALLRANLGWGNLPEHVARDDLRAGSLVAIRPEAWSDDEHRLLLSAIFRAGAATGPAHAWLLDRLATLCARDVGPRRSTRKKSTRRRA